MDKSMDYQVHALARQDLLRHYEYIAKDSEKAAEGLIDAASSTFNAVAKAPLSYRLYQRNHPKLEGIRQRPLIRPYNKYLVFYRVLGNEVVQILRVVHSARDLANLFKDGFQED